MMSKAEEALNLSTHPIDPTVFKLFGLVCEIRKEGILIHSATAVGRILTNFNMHKCRAA